MERKISVFILIVLLACTFKVRLMTNANGTVSGGAKEKSKDVQSIESNEKGSVGMGQVKNSEDWNEVKGRISYEEVKRYVDTRIGSFKAASYVPNSVLIRKYDDGQTAVKNSLIDITYQTARGEYHRQIRKIDVFVKSGNNWMKVGKDPLQLRAVAAL